jgi:hypothetical protein
MEHMTIQRMEHVNAASLLGKPIPLSQGNFPAQRTEILLASEKEN